MAQALRLDLLVLCDTAVISRDNKLSIIGIFDQVFVQKLPTQHPKTTLVGVVKGKPDTEHTLGLVFNDVSGKTIANHSVKLQLSAQGGTNVIVELFNLPFAQFGSHTIQVLEDGKVLGSKKLAVLEMGSTGQAQD